MLAIKASSQSVGALQGNATSRQCSSKCGANVITHSASVSVCGEGKQPERWSSLRQCSSSVLPVMIVHGALIDTCGKGKEPERWSSLRRYSLSLLPNGITALCPVIATEASSQSVGAPRGNAAAGAASVITHNALMSTCDKGKRLER